MPNHVSLRIQVNDIWGLIGTPPVVASSNSTIFSSLDPLGGAEDSITQGNVELWVLPVVDNESLKGFFKGLFIMQDTVMETSDLSFEPVDFNHHSSLLLSDGCKETVGDHMEYVWVEFGMGSKVHRNGIG
jgi:hypothetical protein